MTYVDAIYHDGVFKPLQPVNFQEQQRVRLTIQPVDQKSVEKWLEDLNKLHDGIIKRVGVLPDSAPDIAADRLECPEINGIVVDSSVVAKWVLPEPDTAEAKQLGATASSGNQLIVLDLAYVEVTNAIWSRHRRKLITTLQAESALQSLFQSPVQVVAAAELLESALQIGIRYDCAIYDAIFVALVSKTGFQGVTADEPLYRAVHADYPTIVLLRDWK